MNGGEFINVHEELANARVTRFHWRLGASMGALTLFDGYDTFNPAYVIHYVMQPWSLKPGQAGLLVSSGLIGFLFGAAVHGLVADRLGRRVTLLGGLWIASIFTLATPILGISFWPFCTIRLLTGLGLGVLLPLATTYINELTPRYVANTYTIWGVGFGWAIGGSLAGVAGVFVTPHYGWKSLYWIGCFSFLLIPILYVTLPESVKFLALSGRIEEIKTILARLRPEHGGRYRHARISVDSPATTGNAMVTLLSERYRRTTLSIWTAAFFCLFCIFGLSGWIPTVMLQRGETFAASFAFGALMQIAGFLGGLACGYISDRLGSRRVMIVVWWGLGAASVFTLLLFNNHVINFSFVAAAGFFIIGGQFVLNNFTANAYETRVRATAVGMELSVGRVGAILGPWVAGVLQELYSSLTAMFMVITVAALIAAMAIALARGENQFVGSAVVNGSNLKQRPA
jgi:AAHS family 4-hydroxybenzoate transporter-like MFS transporter